MLNEITTKQAAEILGVKEEHIASLYYSKNGEFYGAFLLNDNTDFVYAPGVKKEDFSEDSPQSYLMIPVTYTK